MGAGAQGRQLRRQPQGMVDVVVVPLADIVAGRGGQGPVAQSPQGRRTGRFCPAHRRRPGRGDQVIQAAPDGLAGGGIQHHHQFAGRMVLCLEGGDGGQGPLHPIRRQAGDHQAAHQRGSGCILHRLRPPPANLWPPHVLPAARELPRPSAAVWGAPER